MEFFSWLVQTPLADWIRSQSPWLWPLSETLHFIGLALLLGVAGIFDLRLLGFFKRVPVKAFKDALPWAVVGLGINFVTGMVFFIGSTYQYVPNWAWWAKVAFIAVAGVNVLIFETRFGDRAAAVGPNEDTPTTLKIIGAVSLISWLSVLYFGRMMAFIGGTC